MMAISMENNNITSDTGQDKTEWQSVWRITIVLTLDKIKMIISMENYSVTSDTGQDKTEWQFIWRIKISIVTLDKMKLNGNSLENCNII